MRFRLTLWYSSLLLVFGLAFVVALNVAARLDQPHIYELELGDVEFQVIRGPGAALDQRPPGSTVTITGIISQTERQLYEENLDRLRLWSIVAVIGLVATSAVGGYVISGFLLHPVREITRVASEISATNLERRISHAGADDELKELADTFDSMIGRLEEAFESQQRFVQDASHELRTPLTAIRTNIEVAEMDPGATTEDYLEVFGLVKAQTERLSRLTEDLLLLTRPAETAEAGPIDLEQVVREVLRHLSGLAARRGVTIEDETRPGIEVVANGDHLFRCLSNLVDNAIKYSGERARVRVFAGREGSMAVMRVSDSGPGIPADALPRIFDRFYRVDKGRSRAEGGAGLGLAIVKELVVKMGGSVEVESVEGAGSTFTIRLPAPSSREAARQGGRSASQPWVRTAAPPV